MAWRAGFMLLSVIDLLLHNEKIRKVIDTITSKAVLILGRFTPERKKVLDALRDGLRQRNRTSIVSTSAARAARTPPIRSSYWRSWPAT